MLLDALKKCRLFADIEEDELTAMLSCLNAVRRTYDKDSFIFEARSKAASVGIVISGGVYVIQEDFWGNRTLLTHAEAGGMFAEAFSCAETDSLPVSVTAAEKSEILLIDTRKIITSCSSACVFHTRLIRNLLSILAAKSIALTRKMEHLSKKTTREKLLSFLSEQSYGTGSDVVEIPFNRQDLADYLCVDRSALSRELGAMRRDGLIECKKNVFRLLKQTER